MPNKPMENQCYVIECFKCGTVLEIMKVKLKGEGRPRPGADRILYEVNPCPNCLENARNGQET